MTTKRDEQARKFWERIMVALAQRSADGAALNIYAADAYTRAWRERFDPDLRPKEAQ